MRRSGFVAISGLALVVAGSALGGCARSAADAAGSPSTTATVVARPAAHVQAVVEPVVPAAPEPPPCRPAAQACVRLSTAQAWLRLPGQPTVGPVSIGYGVGEYATPTGFFHVSWKAEHYTSREYHEPMPDAVFFAAGGIAFHAGSLDTDSHGCVHLAPAVAAQFFAALAPGAEVEVLR